MKATPATGVTSSADGIAITERFVLPTPRVCNLLEADDRIVGGGPTHAATGCLFLVRAESPARVEEIVTALPRWPRPQTTLVPLTRFRGRAATVRPRLLRLRESTANRN